MSAFMLFILAVLSFLCLMGLGLLEKKFGRNKWIVLAVILACAALWFSTHPL